MVVKWRVERMIPIDAELLKQAIEEELANKPYSEGLNFAIRCFVARQIEKQPILSVDMYSGENRRESCSFACSRWLL